jgi:peptide/nickel transport system substrate-binding protein
VQKAKRLLAEAGYPRGLSVDLYTSDPVQGMTIEADAYAQMAAEAGIEVNVIRTPADSYWDNIHYKRAFSVGEWVLRPTGTTLAIAYRFDAPWNETQWHRRDYDKLLDEASQKADPKERRAIYQEAQKLLSDEGGAIIPVIETTVAAIRKGCSGSIPNAADIPDLRYLKCGTE